jgi:bifunctional non-homologous end joining protein LigD
MRAALVPPMLATLGDLPRGPGWAAEFKWDGVRAVTYLDAGTITVLSRNDRDITSQYPELGAITGMLPRARVVLDGEIVALDARGVPDFALLQNRMHVAEPGPALLDATPVIYYPFDVLALDGEPTLARPYAQRRALLDDLGLTAPPVQAPPAFLDAHTPDVYATAVQHGLEGVVCKRMRSTYQPGRRSPDWIKTPVQLTTEVVIVGWQPGQGRRGGGIGSLLLGAPDPAGRLVYTGKVGTGFTQAMLTDLASRLAPLTRPTPAVAEVPRDQLRTTRWVEPTIVGEVAYRNRTPDGRLRHPSWRGLCPDRHPDDAILGQS